jgi:hypothetical protein
MQELKTIRSEVKNATPAIEAILKSQAAELEKKLKMQQSKEHQKCNGCKLTPTKSCICKQPVIVKPLACKDYNLNVIPDKTIAEILKDNKPNLKNTFNFLVMKTSGEKVNLLINNQKVNLINYPYLDIIESTNKVNFNGITFKTPGTYSISAEVVTFTGGDRCLSRQVIYVNAINKPIDIRPFTPPSDINSNYIGSKLIAPTIAKINTPIVFKTKFSIRSLKNNTPGFISYYC